MKLDRPVSTDSNNNFQQISNYFAERFPVLDFCVLVL